MSLAWRQTSFAGRHSDIRGFTHVIYPSEEPTANYVRPSFASKRAQVNFRGVSLHLARFCLQGKSYSAPKHSSPFVKIMGGQATDWPVITLRERLEESALFPSLAYGQSPTQSLQAPGQSLP